MSDPYERALAAPDASGRFPDDARLAVYEAIALRRDVRHFRADAPVDDDTLQRLLVAAHLAPSVGLSQPWGFVIVRDVATRTRVRESFQRCREVEAARFPPERRDAYLAHRLEGILDAPVNVCVTVDLRDHQPILGTTAQPETLRFSVCCAVQNRWLAARAEGLGVGWVSIVEPRVLRAELGLPDGVEPIAYERRRRARLKGPAAFVHVRFVLARAPDGTTDARAADVNAGVHGGGPASRAEGLRWCTTLRWRSRGRRARRGAERRGATMGCWFNVRTPDRRSMSILRGSFIWCLTAFASTPRARSSMASRSRARRALVRRETMRRRRRRIRGPSSGSSRSGARRASEIAVIEMKRAHAERAGSVVMLERETAVSGDRTWAPTWDETSTRPGGS